MKYIYIYSGGQILQCDSFVKYLHLLETYVLSLSVTKNIRRSVNCSFPSSAKELVTTITFPNRHTISSVDILPSIITEFNPLNPELNPICYLLALLGVHHFLHVSRIRVKSLTFRLLMSYIYGAHILDVYRSHTTTQHSR